MILGKKNTKAEIRARWEGRSSCGGCWIELGLMRAWVKVETPFYREWRVLSATIVCKVASSRGPRVFTSGARDLAAHGSNLSHCYGSCHSWRVA